MSTNQTSTNQHADIGADRIDQRVARIGWRDVAAEWNGDRDALVITSGETGRDIVVGPAGPWGYRDIDADPVDRDLGDVWRYVLSDRAIDAETGAEIVDGHVLRIDVSLAAALVVVREAPFHYGRDPRVGPDVRAILADQNGTS